MRTDTSAKQELGASALHAEMYTWLGADAATLHAWSRLVLMDVDCHGRHGLRRINTAHLSISKIYHSELLSGCANSKRGQGE